MEEAHGPPGAGGPRRGPGGSPLLQEDVVEVLEEDLVGQQAHHDVSEWNPAGTQSEGWF